MINTNPNSRNAVFDKVGGLSLSRTAFNLSEEKSFDCDFGEIIPVYHRYMIPGDTFKVNVRSLIKFNPLVSPFYGKVSVRYDLFKVPIRLLWFDWEEYLTKGVTGEAVRQLPLSSRNFIEIGEGGILGDNFDRYTRIDYWRYSLWDYLGYPEPHFYDENGVDLSEPKYLNNVGEIAYIDNASMPHSFPETAYLCIWNEYYRDQNLQKPFIWAGSPVLGYNNRENYPDLGDESSPAVQDLLSDYQIPRFSFWNDSILKRAYRKDYFTSALPFQQRGVTPAIPISGVLPLDLIPQYDTYLTSASLRYGLPPGISGGDGQEQVVQGLDTTSSQALSNISGSVNLADGGVTADIAQIKLAFAIQKWQERNARAGVRYTEYLQAHYGVRPRDERLQRPEFIGSIVHPIVVSEVLQTSQTTDSSALGDFAGHAQGSDIGGFESVFAEEFCVLMCTMTIIPKPVYNQGVQRELLYKSPLEWFTPEFQNLSEQAVTNNELFVTFSKQHDDNSTVDVDIFGFQGRYNELRTSYDRSMGALRGNSIGKWTLNRTFKEAPSLNESFIQINGQDYKDILAVPSSKTCICNVGVDVTAIRPLQYVAEPGLIDHN